MFFLKLILQSSSITVPSQFHRCSIETMDYRWSIDGVSSEEEGRNKEPKAALFLHLMLYDKIYDSDENKCNDGIFDIVAILFYLALKLIFRYNAIEIPSKTSKDTVPYACSNGSKEDETAKVHPCKSGRNTNEMSDARDETTCYCCHLTMIIKIFLALLHLLLIEKTHLTPFAISKAVDDRTTEILTREIVDCSTTISTDSGKQYHEPYIKTSTSSMICSR